MNINQRIKMLRKEMGLNQKDFGAKIGLGQAGLSRLEQDGVVVIDQNIRLICDTFNISENWLRNGEGPKEAASTKKDLLDEVRDTYKLNSTEEQIMRIYLQLDEHSREVISGYVKKLATAITTAQEISNKKTPAELDAETAAFRQELERWSNIKPRRTIPTLRYEIFPGECPETSVENKIRVVVSKSKATTQYNKKEHYYEIHLSGDNLQRRRRLSCRFP